MRFDACQTAALNGGENTVLRPEWLVGTARMPNRSFERLEQKGSKRRGTGPLWPEWHVRQGTAAGPGQGTL